MAIATDSTINELVGDSSSLTDTPIINPDAPDTDSTVELDKSADSQADALNGSDKDDGDDNTATADNIKDDRYDKDPAWQRIIKERNEAKEANIRLEERLRYIEEQMNKKGTAEPDHKLVSPTYQDITQMSDEDIAEAMANSPKKFAANLYAQIREEVKRDITTEEREARRQEQTRKTYSVYEKENPDFVKMWKAGEVQAFMDDHPGHNPISAHMVMTRESRMTEELEKAKGEAIKDIEKKTQAKHKASVLGSGPANAGKPLGDKVFEDTSKHGGFTKVMANMLQSMRSANTT